nr:uncharacterized protein LOC109154521 isoform X2 [Ipomoea batatas]
MNGKEAGNSETKGIDELLASKVPEEVENKLKIKSEGNTDSLKFKLSGRLKNLHLKETMNPNLGNDNVNVGGCGNRIFGSKNSIFSCSVPPELNFQAEMSEVTRPDHVSQHTITLVIINSQAFIR